MQEKLPLTFAECKTKLETGEDRFFIYIVHYQKKWRGRCEMKKICEIEVVLFFFFRENVYLPW